jgi:hypothetical protein
VWSGDGGEILTDVVEKKDENDTTEEEVDSVLDDVAGGWESDKDEEERASPRVKTLGNRKSLNSNKQILIHIYHSKKLTDAPQLPICLEE